MLIYNKRTDLGIKASSVDFSQLTTNTQKIQDSPYGIPTLNKQGYEKTGTNDYIDGFVDIAASTKNPLLEIGSAFGNIVQRVLKVQGRITACDIEEEHLEIIIKNTIEKDLENLHVYLGQFPNKVEFPKNTFEAIMAARVLHFLTIEDLEKGFRKIYDWLIPGGKFFFICMSVYHESIKEHIFSTYKKNVENGLKWCGIIEDQLKFAPQHALYAPKFIHVFDVPELERIMPDFGFKIDKIELFSYLNDVSSGEKGHIGFVATKN